MAKAEKIEVEIDWDKAIKGFRALALVFERFAFQCETAAKTFEKINASAPTNGVDKPTTSE
jgi:hypothetical protein